MKRSSCSPAVLLVRRRARGAPRRRRERPARGPAVPERSATAATTSSTTTSTCATPPARRRRPLTARSRSWPRPRRTCRASTSTSRARASAAISVNGLPAKFTRTPDDLVITPRLPLRNGLPFIVRVSHFVAAPTEANSDDFSTTAFFFHPAGSATAPQPNWAHLFLPSNDHPRDKASFDIRFDVPAGPDRRLQRRQARAVDRSGPDPRRLRAAPADGHRAAAARGRAIRRDERRVPLRRLPARRDLQEHHCARSSRCSASRPRRSTTCRTPSASTRSTSTARSWSRPTSASPWRRRRSS